MDIAKINSTGYADMASAAAAVTDGQTVNVLRSGSAGEVSGAFTKPGSYKILGDKSALPKLSIDVNTRPAWGKAVLNLEDGSYEIGYLHIDGCAVPDSNGAAIRLNPTTKDTLIHHVRLTNNENGVLTSEGTETLTLADGVADSNGRSTDPSRRGYSHNIYVGKIAHLVVTRFSFLNSAYGHDFKSRAFVNDLTQVICSGSANGRALDVPNGGILHATDCEFAKPASATQNNLIDIGAEGITDGREEEYIFTNCKFHIDVDPGRDVQYLNNRSNVEVVLIDPLFTGAAAAKDRKQTVKGNVRVVLTGGPLGPRAQVGGDPGATSTAPAQTASTNKFEVLAAAPGDGTWAKLGDEGATVTVTDGTVVRYGANGSYVYARATGKVTANNTVFGKDPIRGSAKIIEAFTPAATQPTSVLTPAPTQAPSSAITMTFDADATGKFLSALTGRTVTVTVK